MSDKPTPRTDAFYRKHPDPREIGKIENDENGYDRNGYVWVSFARQLERELTAARSRIAELREELRDAARDAATEERWKHSQGEDYGSY